LLIFILTESALELVPKKIANHPSIRKHAARKKKKPGEILLDRTYHHAAMRRLAGAEKRGRPDIAHITLLQVLGTPLNMSGMLKTYLHTAADYVIEIDSRTNLPRNYERFVGLMEQLHVQHRVPSKGARLLSIKKATLSELLNEVQPSKTLAFSTMGRAKSLQETCEAISGEKNPAVIVGGFPHGHFSADTMALTDEIVSIHPQALDAWVVASRIIYEYERAIGL